MNLPVEFVPTAETTINVVKGKVGQLPVAVEQTFDAEMTSFCHLEEVEVNCNDL